MLVEGAGSASEVNLRKSDIANMGFARAADVPVVLVGDIDRGGVIASLVGTKAVIDAADAAMIVGFIVNRFRGDPTLFDDGMKTVSERTGWPALGLVPYFNEAHRLPAEDAVVLQDKKMGSADGRVRVAVLVYPRIANFDDFDPLRLDPGVDLVFVGPAPAGAGRLPSWSSCPARSRPSPISPRCGNSAGTSTSRRICGAAASCWASAAATRCSAAPSPIRTASRGHRRKSTASACSTSTPCSKATRSWSR